ncbi:MAG: hypothetical protein K0R64_2175 [Novosphingobium lindaniclasticum]|nr:hypothetical protein [Novosphingobium lindaniclasticum]
MVEQPWNREVEEVKEHRRGAERARRSTIRLSRGHSNMTSSRAPHPKVNIRNSKEAGYLVKAKKLTAVGIALLSTMDQGLSP